METSGGVFGCTWVFGEDDMVCFLGVIRYTLICILVCLILGLLNSLAVLCAGVRCLMGALF